MRRTRPLIPALTELLNETRLLMGLVDICSADDLPPDVVEEQSRSLRQDLRKYFPEIRGFGHSQCTRHLLNAIVYYAVAVAVMAEASRSKSPGSPGHVMTWRAFKVNIDRALEELALAWDLLDPDPDAPNSPGNPRRLITRTRRETDRLLRNGRLRAREHGIEFFFVAADDRKIEMVSTIGYFGNNQVGKTGLAYFASPYIRASMPKTRIFHGSSSTSIDETVRMHAVVSLPDPLEGRVAPQTVNIEPLHSNLLPRWARVAFAARWARRVESLFSRTRQSHWGEFAQGTPRDTALAENSRRAFVKLMELQGNLKSRASECKVSPPRASRQLWVPIGVGGLKAELACAGTSSLRAAVRDPLFAVSAGTVYQRETDDKREQDMADLLSRMLGETGTLPQLRDHAWNNSADDLVRAWFDPCLGWHVLDRVFGRFGFGHVIPSSLEPDTQALRLVRRVDESGWVDSHRSESIFRIRAARTESQESFSVSAKLHEFICAVWTNAKEDETRNSSFTLCGVKERGWESLGQCFVLVSPSCFSSQVDSGKAWILDDGPPEEWNQRVSASSGTVRNDGRQVSPLCFRDLVLTRALRRAYMLLSPLPSAAAVQAQRDDLLRLTVPIEFGNDAVRRVAAPGDSDLRNVRRFSPKLFGNQKKDVFDIKYIDLALSRKSAAVPLELVRWSQVSLSGVMLKEVRQVSRAVGHVNDVSIHNHPRRQIHGVGSFRHDAIGRHHWPGRRRQGRVQTLCTLGLNHRSKKEEFIQRSCHPLHDRLGLRLFKEDCHG